MKKLLTTLIGASLLVSANAADVLSQDKAKAIVAPFYQALNAGNDSANLIKSITTEDFVACADNAGKTCESRDTVANNFAGYDQIIPDIKWEIQDVYVAGDNIIVRGEGSGTPNIDFLGVPNSGKSFKVMSIDIHTIKGDKIAHTYHLEDWATAMHQLKADEANSKETLAVATQFMEAMGKGDMDTVASLMADDMVWHNEGDKAMPWIGPWEGKKAILETFMPTFGENFKTTEWKTEDAFAEGDTASFFGKMKGSLNKSNQETPEFTFALRVKVKDGKIVLWNWFEDSYAVSKAYHADKK